MHSTSSAEEKFASEVGLWRRAYCACLRTGCNCLYMIFNIIVKQHCAKFQLRLQKLHLLIIPSDIDYGRT